MWLPALARDFNLLFFFHSMYSLNNEVEVLLLYVVVRGQREPKHRIIVEGTPPVHASPEDESSAESERETGRREKGMGTKKTR